MSAGFTAGNGFGMTNPPGVGLETEPSGEFRIERVRERISAWERRGRSGTPTPQGWPQRRCGRVKGRSEFPAPAVMQAVEDVFAALTHRTPKAPLASGKQRVRAHFRRRSNAVHAGGSLNR